MSDEIRTLDTEFSEPASTGKGLSRLTLADLEQADNPIVNRIIARVKSQQAAADGRRANHSSHSSSPGGKGHTSYVSGRFEDA